MIIKEATNFTTITNKLKRIYVELSEINVDLDDLYDGNMDMNSKDGKQIAKLLCNIYWKLDHIEGDGYFDRHSY